VRRRNLDAYFAACWHLLLHLLLLLLSGGRVCGVVVEAKRSELPRHVLLLPSLPLPLPTSLALRHREGITALLLRVCGITAEGITAPPSITAQAHATQLLESMFVTHSLLCSSFSLS
jgi:hypothetical protein